MEACDPHKFAVAGSIPAPAPSFMDRPLVGVLDNVRAALMAAVLAYGMYCYGEATLQEYANPSDRYTRTSWRPTGPFG